MACGLGTVSSHRHPRDRRLDTGELTFLPVESAQAISIEGNAAGEHEHSGSIGLTAACSGVTHAVGAMK